MLVTPERSAHRPAIAPISGPAANAIKTSARTSMTGGAAPSPASESSSSASEAGATSERRRLSSIFQRLMARKRR